MELLFRRSSCRFLLLFVGIERHPIWLCIGNFESLGARISFGNTRCLALLLGRLLPGWGFGSTLSRRLGALPLIHPRARRLVGIARIIPIASIGPSILSCLIWFAFLAATRGLSVARRSMLYDLNSCMPSRSTSTAMIAGQLAVLSTPWASPTLATIRHCAPQTM